MPSTYNGLPANIVGTQVSGNIQSSSNVTPIVIQTAATLPASVLTGDYVHIKQHQTNGGAAGIWPIVVIDSTHFSLTGATGTGTGGATGTWTDLQAGPTSNIPSDGDAANAASFNTPYQAGFDRTAALALMTGKYAHATNNAPSNSTFFTDTAAGAVTAWASASSLTLNTWTAAGTGWSFSDDVVAGDFIEVELTSSMALHTGTVGDIVGVSIWSGYGVPGTTPTLAKMPASGQMSGTTGLDIPIPFHLHAWQSAPSSGILTLNPYVFANRTNDAINLIGDYRVIVKVWRPTVRAT